MNVEVVNQLWPGGHSKQFARKYRHNLPELTILLFTENVYGTTRWQRVRKRGELQRCSPISNERVRQKDKGEAWGRGGLTGHSLW